MPSLINALNQRLDYLTTRQSVVAGNIANASTPNYLSKDVTFESYVQKTPGIGMAVTNEQHMVAKPATPNMRMTKDTTWLKHDGNSVKLDEEMMKLNDIQLNYSTVSQLYQKHKQMYQLAVRAAQ